MEQLDCADNAVTLDVDGYKIKVPYDLTKEERHEIIGAVALCSKLTDEMKNKIIVELVKFGKRQMQ